PEQLTTAEGAKDSSFDFDAFVSLLTGAQKGTAANSPSDSGVTSAYSFIPTGLISSQITTPKRTALQSALFDYGNEVGSAIQSFELEHPNAAQVLWNHAQDRTDTSKIDALSSLARGMTN